MFCAIDFGTSNSAIAIPAPAGEPAAMRLVELEPGHTTMPTAVFYFVEGPEHDGPPRAFGRAAIAAYVDGLDGRLMRSMKSILGSPLIDQATDVGGGRGVNYLDIVAGYLRHLKRKAEAAAGTTIRQVVLGRPVFFVDDDPARDAQAQAALERAAQRAGFDEIRFEYEPIAAAFDYEQRVTEEQTVLVADIGGGTSDFSVVRVGPADAAEVGGHRAENFEGHRESPRDRRHDILANHGVHVAGTDFDRRIELAAILPEYGFGAMGPSIAGSVPREVPSGVYFDLATWHLINTVYSPGRVAELRNMRGFYGQPRQHDRLMVVVDERLGHELAGCAETAKIAVATGGATRIDLGHTERGLAVGLDEQAAVQAISVDIERIVGAAHETVARAGLSPEQIDALYFTGGSTGLRLLSDRIAAAFPGAQVVRGDRFASVATGLALQAQRWFGA